MSLLSYITIEKFKIFGDTITIPLGNPSVLIGPNNAGKTTIIQALALWSWSVKKWYEKKGTSKTKKNLSTSLNRLDIIQVPVKETRFFWKNAAVREGNNPLMEMKITVGVNLLDKIVPCEIIFKYYNPEQIYCYPNTDTFEEKGLLKYVSTLNVNLLYPMSGMEIDEPLLQEGRINLLIGQGQTAQVLRNLCYKVIENDEKQKSDDWKKIADLMKKLFKIELRAPTFNATRGSVELTYFVENNPSHYPLDVSLAGRGQQQILLLLAYLYAHKRSVLLIDEPDAHLEILRQRQIFVILKDLCQENENQLILATHSEVIVDEAVDTNLSLLLNGKCIPVNEKTRVKDTLRTYGIEHYYKAELRKKVLYIEGSTDIAMLRAFAAQLQHPLHELLGEALYYYYTSDVIPDNSVEKALDKSVGNYRPHKQHFYAVQSCVPGFKGIAVFDNDNRNPQDEITDDLTTVFWRRYELENYFVEPGIIVRFVERHLLEQGLTGLFEIEREAMKNKFEDSMNQVILERIFAGNMEEFKDYLTLPAPLQRRTFLTLMSSQKASVFLDSVLMHYSEATKTPLLLSKGEYYKLIALMSKEEIDTEIVQKIELIFNILR